MRGIVRRVFQRLHEECLTDVGDIAGKLTHLVGLSAVGVFESHSQHLVGLQRHLQRHIAERRVHRVFRRVQQSGVLQFLIVAATREIGLLVEHRRRLVDAAGVHILAHHCLILGVRAIRGHRQACFGPSRVRDVRVFAQVGQRDDASGVVRVSRLVGHPQLHAVDFHARRQVGQCLHACIVFVAEELGEEEVAVFLVVGGIDFERSELNASTTRNALRGRLLLRCHKLQLQLAELQVGAQSEEARSALDETGIRGERHVSTLNELHDFVFLSIVFQLQVLRVEVHRGLGVVVEVHVHLVAHLSVDAQVDFLVEVHRGGLAVSDGQRGILNVLQRGAKLQFGRSLRLDSHTARTENLLSRTQLEMHVGEVELFLALCLIDFIVLRAEILAHVLLSGVVHVLLGSHHDGRGEPRVAHLLTDDIAVDGVVVFHLLLHVLRPIQVHRVLPQVVVGDGGGALDGPTGMEQRVGNGVFVVQNGLLDDDRLQSSCATLLLVVSTLLLVVSTLLLVVSALLLLGVIAALLSVLLTLPARVVLENGHRHSIASQTDDQQHNDGGVYL